MQIMTTMILMMISKWDVLCLMAKSGLSKIKKLSNLPYSKTQKLRTSKPIKRVTPH